MKIIAAYIKQLPSALKKQLLLRVAGVVSSLILFAVILIFTKEFVFSLPCLIFAVFLFVNLGMMLYNIIIGSYVCVQGICEHIDTVGLRKKVKSITVNLNGTSLVLPIRQRFKKILPGSIVTIYMSEKTPVYEKDGLNYAYEYYALEFSGRVKQ